MLRILPRIVVSFTSIALLFVLFGCVSEEEEPSAATVPAAVPRQYDTPPPMTIDPDKKYTATFEMAKGGKIVIQLFAKEAPVTVNSFVFLARDGYFDGVTFHRVIPDFMAQGGDPTGTGYGGPGYRFDNEFSPIRRHDGPGVLSMANSGMTGGRGTNGSQFFIIQRKGGTEWLEGRHTVFGEVTVGMDVVDRIARVKKGANDKPLEPVTFDVEVK